MQTPKRINYDQAADSYDNHPLRQKVVDPHLKAFLVENKTLLSHQLKLLDLGCGTGNQLIANYPHYRTSMFIGLDASFGMVRQARSKAQQVSWLQADGSYPPFSAQAFHYISNQFSYHHFNDKTLFFSAIAHLLKPGGRFVLTNLCPEDMLGWIYYRYFPEARTVDAQDFIKKSQLKSSLTQAGLVNIKLTLNKQTYNQNLVEFYQQVRQRHHCSQLTALPDRAYQAGLRHLQGDIAQAQSQPISLSSEVCLLTLQGDKP